jgi:hypothetical protein
MTADRETPQQLAGGFTRGMLTLATNVMQRHVNDDPPPEMHTLVDEFMLGLDADDALARQKPKLFAAAYVSAVHMFTILHDTGTLDPRAQRILHDAAIAAGLLIAPTEKPGG